MRRIALSLALLLAASAAVADSAATRPAPIPSAHEVIDRAFQNFYMYDLHQNVDLTVREGGDKVLEYRTEMMRKFIDGRAHSLYRFTGDGDRREFTALRIEQMDRPDDAFVYLPELMRPRRVVIAQTADKFFGLELTIEDLEIRRIERYEVVGRSFDRVDGELTYVVTVAPLYDSGYDRADYFVAVKDYALLQARYYRRGALEPYKFLHARREWMEVHDGHVLPRRLDLVDRSLGTETVIHFSERRVNPHLPRSHFSTLSLEKRLRLARYRDRSGPEEDTP